MTRDNVNIKQQHCLKLLFFLGFVLPVRYTHISVNWVNPLNICLSRKNINIINISCILLRITAHMQRMPESIQIKNKQTNSKPNFQTLSILFMMIIYVYIYISISANLGMSALASTLYHFSIQRGMWSNAINILLDWIMW